jgi:hypothetical protein
MAPPAKPSQPSRKRASSTASGKQIKKKPRIRKGKKKATKGRDSSSESEEDNESEDSDGSKDDDDASLVKATPIVIRDSTEEEEEDAEAELSKLLHNWGCWHKTH